MERKEIAKTGKRLEEKEGCGKGKDGGKEGKKKNAQESMEEKINILFCSVFA